MDRTLVWRREPSPNSASEAFAFLPGGDLDRDRSGLCYAIAFTPGVEVRDAQHRDFFDPFAHRSERMGGDEFTSFQTRARRALGKVEEKPDARDPLCSRNFQGLGKGVARCPERKSEGLFCLKNSGLGRGGELECPDAADCIEVFRPPFSGKSENFEPERLGTAEDFFVGFRQVFIEEVVVEVTRVTRPLESFFPSGCDCADQSGWGEIDAACPGGDEEFLESDPASLAVAFRVDPGDQSLAIDRDPDGMLGSQDRCP